MENREFKENAIPENDSEIVVKPMPDLDITAQEVLSSLFNADETVCLRVFADRKDDHFRLAKSGFSKESDLRREYDVRFPNRSGVRRILLVKAAKP